MFTQTVTVIIIGGWNFIFSFFLCTFPRCYVNDSMIRKAIQNIKEEKNQIIKQYTGAISQTHSPAKLTKIIKKKKKVKSLEGS